VIHGWGQFSSEWSTGARDGEGDSADLDTYIGDVNPNAPAMYSFYVAPELVPQFIRRFRHAVTMQGFFFAQVGLNFRGSESAVAAGNRDAQLQALARTLRDFGQPVLLRIGYEFNNPWQPYSPGEYVAAFRHVVEVFRREHADNVAAVWNATAIGLARRPWSDWYPGDDVVDWWSVNLFGFRDFTNPATAAFLDDSRKHRKPVLIGEAAPVLESRLPWSVRGPDSDEEALRWFNDLIELIRRRPEIQGISLIAVFWPRLRRILPEFGWPDTRLSQWPKTRAAWKRALADHRYINRYEALRVYSNPGFPLQ
jgi:hypothetical protein